MLVNYFTDDRCVISLGHIADKNEIQCALLRVGPGRTDPTLLA
jgi:hypothetical protein